MDDGSGSADARLKSDEVEQHPPGCKAGRDSGAGILAAMKIRMGMRIAFIASAIVTACLSVTAQAPAATAEMPHWKMQESGTTASLRGIDSIDGKVAWASGTEGTVLRTTDGGEHWKKCAVPDAATDGATLDFRGLQAWDLRTAIVMASGPGEKSRLYKTVDGCATWKLLLKNPDKDGFWDAIRFEGMRNGIVLGDVVRNRFAVFITHDGGEHWKEQASDGLAADAKKDAIFAASNSSLVAFSALAHRYFVTGGSGGAYFFECHSQLEVGGDPSIADCLRSAVSLPLSAATVASGAFSLGFSHSKLVAVGGDYTKPNEGVGTAAWTADGGKTWTAAAKPPHGYRSSVAWSEALHAWVAVGTNGTDMSRDDGKTWTPVDDGNWNALSMPYVVGPKGRIGILRVGGRE
jgi:photosystem II stability/assembly factor-like uncharacterized protein